MTKPDHAQGDGGEDRQSADQIAQQTAQQAGQAAAEAVRTVIDASRTARSQEIGAESEFETGSDEFWKWASQLSAVNAKRTYDEEQDQSLRRRTDASTHAKSVDNLAVQALQNAVETANMVSKQAVRHSDIAIDRQWNVNETDAYATILAGKIADSLNLKK